MKTTTFLTDQELYNKAAKHLLTQKSTAVLFQGGAAYRGRDGKCCPIGNMISTKDYTTALESVPVRFLTKEEREMTPKMVLGVRALRRALEHARVDTTNEKTVSLLSKLQNVHDAFGVWEWRERLTNIAREHGLNATVLSE